MEVRPVGPVPARIMIVGEAPGADEVIANEPFVGASGKELNRMLGESGVTRGECFITNLCRIRPPGNDISVFIAKAKKDRTSKHTILRDKAVLDPIVQGYRQLLAEIQSVKPNIILALGNTALWALTGEWGIQRWRGSMMYTNLGANIHEEIKVIPTYHPAAILRAWDLRAQAVHDIKRAASFRQAGPYPDPNWKFTIEPDFNTAVNCLRDILSQISQGHIKRISFDIETANGHIDCAGIAWSAHDAICIPLCRGSEHYWELEEHESYLVFLLYQILTHPKVEVVGQNLLFDSQYCYRRWHFIPRVKFDTMIAWHVAFVGLPKKLDFQASMLCEYYRQWKPDRSKHKEGG